MTNVKKKVYTYLGSDSMKQETKKIYIVLTYTGTILSKIIRVYTKAEFSHVSLALDNELSKMYSFGRLNPYNPFSGGFVEEGINVGTFKRFKNTKTEIYCLEVTNYQYKKLEKKIKEIKKIREIYKFNRLGMFLSAVNYRFKRKNRFYCAEFVKYLIDDANLELNLPDAVKPIDFKNYSNLDLLYKGVLRNYK